MYLYCFYKTHLLFCTFSSHFKCSVHYHLWFRVWAFWPGQQQGIIVQGQLLHLLSLFDSSADIHWLFLYLLIHCWRSGSVGFDAILPLITLMNRISFLFRLFYSVYRWSFFFNASSFNRKLRDFCFSMYAVCPSNLVVMLDRW